MCAVVIVLGLALGGLAGAVSHEVPERTGVVTVSDGESLWDLARQHAPDSDPRAVVERIHRLNELEDGSGVAAGAVLTVPVQVPE